MPFDYRYHEFDPAPDDGLMCVICHSVVFVPMESTCKHLFCKSCITAWLKKGKDCPLCREKLTLASLKKAGVGMQKKINKLTLQCPNRVRGCNEKTFIKEFEKHSKSCECRLMKCRKLRCEAMIRMKDRASHEANHCPKLQALCKVCQVPVLRTEKEAKLCFADMAAEAKAKDRKIARLEKALGSSSSSSVPV